MSKLATRSTTQTEERNISNKDHRINNNKRRANQLAIYEHDRTVEPGSTHKQPQLIIVGAGLEPAPSEFQVRGALTKRIR